MAPPSEIHGDAFSLALGGSWCLVTNYSCTCDCTLGFRDWGLGFRATVLATVLMTILGHLRGSYKWAISTDINWWSTMNPQVAFSLPGPDVTLLNPYEPSGNHGLGFRV